MLCEPGSGTGISYCGRADEQTGPAKLTWSIPVEGMVYYSPPAAGFTDAKFQAGS